MTDFGKTSNQRNCRSLFGAPLRLHVGATAAWQRASFAITAVPVPNMGDSISEGTVLKFSKAAGDAVAVDEIVAVLETDKVSVDSRSPLAGVMAELCAKQGDTVQVGAHLFKIDSDGKAAPAPPPSAAALPKAASTLAPAPAAAAAAPSPAAHHGPPARVPSIKFKHGKRGAICILICYHRRFVVPDFDQALCTLSLLPTQQLVHDRSEAAPAPVAASAAAKPAASAVSAPSAVLAAAPADFLAKTLAYRRKPLSADVIAAINSGGASAFDPPPAPAKAAKGAAKGKK